MNKPFQHHDNWFVVYPTLAPNWPDSKLILHVPDKLLKHKWFYHWVQSEGKMYRISHESTVTNRKMYNHRWHISKQWCEEIPVPREWEHFIKDYVRHPDAEAQPDLFKPSGK